MASIAGGRRTLSYAEARVRVLSASRPLPTVTVPLAGAVGRALREAVFAPHDLPPFRNSSMDGFAVRVADLADADRTPVSLPVHGVVAAGHVARRGLGAGEIMRIMTGAAIPEGAEAVVPFEEAESLGSDTNERARFTRPVAAGANIRAAGADVRAGSCVLERGRELSSHDVALLAALGIPNVVVGARPKVAILSTGDELLDIDEPLRPGAIRDSNTLLLTLLAGEAGAEVVRAERVADEPSLVLARMREAIGVADVTLTIGGVSMGDFDPVKQSLEALGDVEWWRVRMKPGQPQAFGTPNERLYFGLPGNPASVACVFEALVRPALRTLQGFESLDRPRIQVRSAATIESRLGRTDFVRTTLEWRGGSWWATPAGAQNSGHLTPQSRAHALVVIPDEVETLAEGKDAEAQLLRWPDSATR